MDVQVAAKVESFFDQYPLRNYPKGHVLIYANEDPKYIYYLKSGQVRVYDIDQHGNEIEVLTYKPSSFFPMSWAINKPPNDYFYSAKEQISLSQAPVAESLMFLYDNKDVMLDLLGRVYRGTDVILRRMAHLMGGNSINRVLFELVIESNRAASGTNAPYGLGLSEAGLAGRAGLSRETVSRVMKNLKSKNLVAIKRNNISVLDLEGLREMLGHLL